MASSRILFVSPQVDETAQLTPDLGIGFLASALRNALYSVDFIDIKRDSISMKELANRIRGSEYLFAGVKVFSLSLREANEVIKAIKEGDPKITIIIGGPHPSYALEESLRSCPQADIAVIGEADEAIVELARRLEKSEPISDVESIAYRNFGKIHVNHKKHFIDSKTLPIPAWDIIDPRLYQKYENLWYFSKGKTIATLSVGRGCPYLCTFCSDFITSGKKVRYRTIESVMEEIKRLQAIYGVDEIHLTDSIFTINKKYVFEFCEAIIKNNIKIHWATPYGTRLDTLDAPLLRVMQESGCYGTSVGIESGSERLIEFMKKGITPQKVEEKLKLIKKTTDMVVQGFFIIGYPTETNQSIRETIDFACRLPLDMAMFSPFRATPGTEIAQWLKDNEPEFTPKWDDHSVEKMSYHPKGITLEELAQWNRRAYREFYLRPHIIWNMLKTMKGKRQFSVLSNKFRRRLFRHSTSGGDMLAQ